MAECYLCGQDSQGLGNKADKKIPSAANNVALLDSSGNLIDSGKQLTPESIGAAKLISRGVYLGDLNNVSNKDGTLYSNSIVWFQTPNGTTNAPVDGYGFCFTWTNGSNILFQELQYTDGTIYRREYFNGGSGSIWHDWQMVLTEKHGKAIDSAKADGITDYTDSSNVIKVGWQGDSIPASDITYVAAYTTDGNIKSARLDNLNTALKIKGGFVQYDNISGMTSNYSYECNPTRQTVSGNGINYGTWTPEVEGASKYTKQQGTFILLGNTCILHFYVYGSFGGNTTSRFRITSTPDTPTETAAGGGSLSGYTSPSNVVFTGWEILRNGNIVAVGQETSTSSSTRYQSTAIYQKASGDFSASGTIAFMID